MCLVRGIIHVANLCPIMINFNALDFIVCRSEEVSFDAQCIILNPSKQWGNTSENVWVSKVILKTIKSVNIASY